MHIVIDARGRQSSSGKYVDRLLEYLQAIDSKNRYTVLLKPGDNWRSDKGNFSTAVCRFGGFSFNPLDQIRFGVFLRRLKPDLVHFWMTPQEPMFFFGKRVTTTHDLTMLRFARAGRLPLALHWVRMAGYRLLLWWSHRLAKCVITPTKFVADDLAKLHPFAKTKTIVTPEASEPPIRGGSKHVKGVSGPFLLYVGSAFPHKNLEATVAAFEKLAAANKDLKLVLTGKKEYYYRQLEKKVAGSEFLERIIFTGFVSDAELKWLYENAELYVFASLSEGFGLPGLEAMAHGCPVVSSNATCLPEVYDDAAHYFDPLNTDDMASKISAVLNDNNLRKQLIRAGYVRVKQFSWRRMAEQTLDVYKQA